MYETFAHQLFAREAWKILTQNTVSLSRNLIKEFQRLCEKIAQSLFKHNSTVLSVQFISETIATTKEEMQLLGGLPVHIAQGQVRFIHKSMQEFFVSQAWSHCLDNNNWYGTSITKAKKIKK